jgi:ATP-binding cassette subfamily B protein
MSNSSSDWTLLRRVLAETRRYRLHVAGLWGLSLLSGPLGLLTPLPLKIAIDSAVGDHPLPVFLQWLLPAAVIESKSAVLMVAVVLMVGITLLTQLQSTTSTVLGTHAAERMVLDFRAKLFRHAQRLSVSYHDMKGIADSVYRVQYDAVSIPYVITDGILPFTSSIFTLLAMLYVALNIDATLALIALTISPVLFGISRIARPKRRNRWNEVKDLDSASLSVVQEVLAAVRVVKAFGREDHEQERYVHSGKAGVKARLRISLIEACYTLSVSMTTAIGMAVVLWISVRHIQSGVLTVGNLLVIMTYIAQLYEPLKRISTQSASLQGYLSSVGRAFELLDEVPDVTERRNARPLARARGSVRFENVSFAYDRTHNVLSDVSFEIPPGARVGIHGRTGAGKSTLMSLLTRFYDISGGRILLDGADLRDYRLADLRNQFGIVLQDSVLFSTTIGENIAYARPGAKEEEIVEAARLANAHDFIAKLPKGYDTLVGDRGMRLSGGERQRISLARAFLKDASILILDEPTSSVDTQTELGILEALQRLMQGRTTFMIAHRLSTLESCDVRLELRDGRLTRLNEAVTSG